MLRHISALSPGECSMPTIDELWNGSAQELAIFGRPKPLISHFNQPTNRNCLNYLWASFDKARHSWSIRLNSPSPPPIQSSILFKWNAPHRNIHCAASAQRQMYTDQLSKGFLIFCDFFKRHDYCWEISSICRQDKERNVCRDRDGKHKRISRANINNTFKLYEVVCILLAFERNVKFHRIKWIIIRHNNNTLLL